MALWIIWIGLLLVLVRIIRVDDGCEADECEDAYLRGVIGIFSLFFWFVLFIKISSNGDDGSDDAYLRGFDGLFWSHRPQHPVQYVFRWLIYVLVDWILVRVWMKPLIWIYGIYIITSWTCFIG
eukprot:188006_1